MWASTGRELHHLVVEVLEEAMVHGGVGPAELQRVVGAAERAVVELDVRSAAG